MIKPLVKNGNSLVLVINKDMLGHMGIEGGEVEILETPRGYVIQRPMKRLGLENAAEAAFAQYDNVFKELAK